MTLGAAPPGLGAGPRFWCKAQRTQEHALRTTLLRSHGKSCENGTSALG
jgi:hypothetical protein